MVADPTFRVITLALGMLILGIGWYLLKINRKENSDETKIKKQIKKEAIHVSTIFGVLHMVIMLGLTAYI
ncbi:hypothetical protein [Natranaerobius trueperi]|uniref:Uncharacterized protein n=1 Tax=Natranaerobius trueperi TaxID=759412 RepID=A0A226BXP3_9FIRM|nr:hypothetical protein [Natranaerobius trueperi]OWZ83766.1 hypothetical protein CDO51_06640 [Natranaerobius trueperi]